MGDLTDEEQKTLFKELEKQSKATSSTLDNLLYWARNQMYNDMVFDPQPIKLYELVNEIFNFYETRAKMKFILFNNFVEQNFKLNADINMSRLILRSLVGNAIKFSHSHG